jgi:hypothetical protein
MITHQAAPVNASLVLMNKSAFRAHIQQRAAAIQTAALFGGSGWESNPPEPALRHLSHGFEDRGAHQDSTAPVYV